MLDDDTKLSDMAVAQSQIEFVNAVHGRVTYGWTEGFFFYSCSDEDKNDKEIVGGGSRRGAGWKRDHFDIAFSDIHNA